MRREKGSECRNRFLNLLKSVTQPFRVDKLKAKALSYIFLVLVLPSLAHATITWTTKAPMPTARNGVAVGIVNNKIYVFGGHDSQSTDYATVEEYDPATNSWATKASMPGGARNGPRAVVNNNKIYVIGGQGTGIVEEYDPATNTWVTKQSMPTARYSFAIGVVNNKIYAIGGNSYGSYTNVVEEYEPATNTWATKQSMPTTRSNMAFGVVNNKIYVFGGYIPGTTLTNVVEEYDPATNTWATKTSMLTSRAPASAGAVVNNKIYVIGGEAPPDRVPTVEVYDPATNTWATETSMPTKRVGPAVAVVNNKIYVIGGSHAPGAATGVNEEGVPDITSPTLSASDSPDPFTPEGDTVTDTTTFTLSASDASGINNWNLKIYSDSAKTALVKTFSGTGTPTNQSWDGKGDDGKQVSNGTYYYVFQACDNASPSNCASTADATVVVDAKAMRSGYGGATAYNNGRRLAKDSLGNLHLVYHSGNPVEIYYVKSSDNGQTWSAPQNLSNNNGTSTNPSIAIDSNNYLHVVWRDNTTGNYEIYYSKYTTSWSEPVNVSNNSGDSFLPSITIDSSNNLLVVWQDYTPGNYEIYYSKYATSWSTPVNISNTAGSWSYPPSIAVDLSNNIYVAWRDDTSGNAEIYHFKYTTSWSTPQNLSNTSASSVAPNLAYKVGTQGADLVWTEGDAAPYEIKYYRIPLETVLPSSTITAPSSNASVSGTSYTITGTASDASGVSKVEVSTDGSTWNTATGTTSWSYTWTLPADGSYTIKSRATDVYANQEEPVTGVAVTVDNTKPTISGIAAGSITDKSAIITWTTNEGSTSQLEYGTSTSYGSTTTLDSNLVTSHSISLSGLTASTLYHYRVKSKDAAGNEQISADNTFTTTATPTTPDTTAPTISSVQATRVTASGATITWITDEAADSKVDYGATASYGSTQTNANMETQHSVNLTGLSAGTTYHYKVTSKDASGNSASSSDYEFTTTAADTTAPTTSGISSGTPAYNSATITFTTDEAAVCSIEYGTTTNYGNATSYETTYATSHSISLTALSANTTYNYKINCKDASSNASSSTNQTFTTADIPDKTAPQITAGPTAGSITDKSAIIAWTTDEASTSVVYYGTTTSYELGSVSDTTLLTSHSMGISNLSASTTYNYKVCSTDAYGNGPTCSANNTFTTTTTSDITAPAVTTTTISVTVTTSTSVTINFTSDESSVCQIKYGATTSYGLTTSLETNYVTSHSIAIINLNSSATYNYTIICKDPSGNESGGTTNNTFTTGDATPPNSSVLKLLEKQSSSTFMVYWSGEDNKTQPSKLTFDVQYKDGATGTWTDWSGKTTTSLTNAEFTGENGHTYYFRCRAKDEAKNQEGYTEQADTYTTVSFIETVNKTEQQEAVVWGMISIPSDPEDKTPSAVFGDDIKNEKLQIHYWNPNKADDAVWYKYQEPVSIELGQGYWLYVNTPVTITVKGKPWNQNANFEKRVYSGWNMIGCPFLFNVDWKNVQFRFGGKTKNLSDAVTEGWVNNYIYAFGKNAQGQIDWNKSVNPDGVVKQWAGYFVYAKVEGDLIFQPVKSLTAKFKEPYVLEEKKKEIEGLSWQMQLKAETGNFADSDNMIGVSDKAKDAYDNFDIFEPPQVKPYVSLYFPHTEWGKEKGSYADDIKSKKSEVTWNMVVETDIKNTNVSLSWNEIKGNSEKIALLDVTTNTLIDMKQNASYAYFSENGGKREFKILYGKDAVEKEQEKRTGPANLLSVYTYPNPYRGANAAGSLDGKGKPASASSGVTFRYKLNGQVTRVEIEVYTMTGKLIDKFVGELDGDTTWGFGEKLSNGVYIYRISAFDASGNRVSKVNKLVVLK